MTTPKHTPGDVDAAIRAAAKRGADLRRTPGTKQRLLCGCEIRLGIESMSLVQCPMHAAAPDLLEALETTSKALFDAWSAQQAANVAGRPGNFVLDMGAYNAARAALAKARGES